MVATLITIVFVTCVAVPSAFAVEHRATKQEQPSTNVALQMLSAVKSVRIGMTGASITTKTNGKSHSMVINYGDLVNGAASGSKKGAGAGSSAGSSGLGSVIPKGLSLMQLSMVLVGLVVLERLVRLVRLMIPHRQNSQSANNQTTRASD